MSGDGGILDVIEAVTKSVEDGVSLNTNRVTQMMKISLVSEGSP